MLGTEESDGRDEERVAHYFTYVDYVEYMSASYYFQIALKLQFQRRVTKLDRHNLSGQTRANAGYRPS